MSNLVIAAGPVIIENGRVLLDRDQKDDFWKFCGGRIEKEDADLRATATREAREELGIDLEILGRAPYLFYTEKEEAGKKIEVILIHFLAKRLGEIAPGPETREWRWFTLEDLDRENLAPNVRPALVYFLDKNIDK